MIFDEFTKYLEAASIDSKFKVTVEKVGGYLTFSNSSNKHFTISLLALRQMLQDILDNLALFSKHNSYVEQDWRDLSNHYTDLTIQSIATVQTKPLFTTLNKVIHWANGQELNDEKKIDLSQGAIEKTISSIDELILFFTPMSQEKEQKEKFSIASLSSASLNFPYKNILFKGVPGTGKSRAIDNIIANELNIDEKDRRNNTLRINIHSASSNADLMQGIGISSSDGKIEYREKQGLIYDLIKRATYHPHQPFVLVLEEIQENSLNELIGDLIYLIEEDKRAKLKALADDKEYAYQELIDMVIDKENSVKYVEIPFLVSNSTEYRKMILPDNLYIFCTSNYRDDKKIIEDNLLRRFEVIEIYPKVDVVNVYAKGFFESLNDGIRKIFDDEMHPDRYMIGHAIWKDVNDIDRFHRAFLKVVTEFKDIKEIEFDTFKEIFPKVKLPEDVDKEIMEQKNYFALINMLQTKIGYGFTN